MIKRIAPHAAFVTGTTRSAIYDFSSGKVYWLNKEGTELFSHFLTNESLNGKETSSFVNEICALLSTSELKSEEYVPNHIKKEELQLALLEVTQRCNCKCIHCYEGDTHAEPEERLTQDQWMDVIDDVAQLGCKSLTFIGGEPTLYLHLPDLIMYASRLRFDSIRVCTNLLSLPESLLEVFSEATVHLRVSVYGPNAAVHDKITQLPGSFDRLIENIRRVQAKGIYLDASVISMRENEGMVAETRTLLRRLSINHIHTDEIRKVYGGSQNEHLVAHSTTDMTEPNFAASSEFFDKAFSYNTCWHGKVVISTDGRVFPCEFARDFVCGNVKEKKLGRIIQGAMTKKYWHLDFGQVAVCKDCEFRFACQDCRPLGYAQYGNIYDKSYRCKYDPYLGEWNAR